MKHNVIILIIIVICINSCRLPEDPVGKINVIKRLDTIDTGGNCLDLDVNMLDSILVVAANYNGFISYNIFDETGALNPSEYFHGTDMAPELGDDRITKIILSEKYNFMILFDQYNKIYFAKKDGTPITYMGDGTLDCVGGAWYDVIIVDNDEGVSIFSLVNHHESEDDASTVENVNYLDYSKSLVWIEYDINNNTIGQNTGNWCEYSINLEYLAKDIFYSNKGLIIVGYGELGVRVFKRLEKDICYDHIMSLSIDQNFEISSFGNTISGGSWSNWYIQETDNGILLTLELDKMPSNISNIEMIDDDGNLHVFDQDTLNGNGEGNRLWIEDIGNNMYNVNIASDKRIQHYQFQLDSKIISIQGDLYEPVTDFELQNNYVNDSYNCEKPESQGGVKGRIFEPAGGLDPNIFAQFDTPGEVEVVYSENNIIIAGLKYSNGCVITQLNNDGSIISSVQFAIGYSVTGIHQNNGLLALATGHDGILLYNWNGTDVSFRGKIETSYANNVKVMGDIIFAATEDGIEIIQIDY